MEGGEQHRDSGPGDTPDAGPRHVLLDGVDALTAAATAVREAAGRAWSLSDGEVRDAVEAMTRVAARVEAARLAVVKALDDRPGAIAGVRPARVAMTFLAGRLNVDPGRAAADVRAAHALDRQTGSLPTVGAGLAAGELTREHADVCVRAVARLPRRLTQVLLDDPDGGEALTGMQVADRWLAEQATRFPVRAVSRLADQLVSILDPDRDERFDPDAHLRRGVSLVRDATGMGQLRMHLTPADAAVLEALLAALGRPHPGRDGRVVDDGGTEQAVLVRDERTVSARRYDALMGLVRAGMSGAGSAADGGASGSPAVHLLVTATVEQVAAAGTAAERRGAGASPPRGPAASAAPTVPQAPAPAPAGETRAARAAPAGRAAGLAHVHRVGPVPPALLDYLSCTAALQRVLLAPDGMPLDVGRTQRLATPAQRKALAVRDGGCVVPGCGCPHEGTDAHHVRAWSAGGATDLHNLVSLCPAHHQQVHAGIWQVEVRAGLPWVRPPAWVDAERRPTRNVLHQSHRAATRIAQQLRLALDGDETAPP